MDFGPAPVREAVGYVLAHSVRLPDGTVVRKGRVLEPGDAARLAEAGVEEVTVARLGPLDVPEDEAAQVLALALAGDGTEVRRPHTGRCNVVAAAHGVLRLDAARVESVNRVHESITVATLREWTTVERGDLVATVKIIPWAAHRARLRECVEAAEMGVGPVVGIDAFVPRRVALVQTSHGSTAAGLLDRGEASLRGRVHALGSRLHSSVRCPHETGAVAEALSRAVGEGLDLVLVLGATAVGDREDVVPAAIRRIGGRVVRLGIPVDPGNLTVVGERDGALIVGVPGCARSSRRNGFDWILERLLSGVPPEELDVPAMGVGGLLKEPPGRPSPRRDGRGGRKRGKRVAGVVLAAGTSRRMGELNKLTEDLGGQPIVRRVVESALGAGLDPVVVVTGHEADAVRGALEGLPVSFVDNDRYVEGIGTSVAAGIGAVPEASDGAVIALGDMPWTRAEDVRALVEAFDPDQGKGICVPVRDRKRGNPVLWSSHYFGELKCLAGDVGAKALMTRYADEVAEVPVSSDGVLLDVDTPEVLREARGG